MQAVRVAWRNIWRNGRRTRITLAAVAINAAVIIWTYALIEGFGQQSVHSITHLVVGDAQLHAPGYRNDRSFYKAIEAPAAVLERADELGVAAAPRSYGVGLISIGSKSAGATFWGIDPEREAAAFELAESIREGSFLNGGDTGKVVLGRRLARTLDAAVDDEIVVVVQAADGSMGNELYTVGGILAAVGEDIDRSGMLLHHKTFESLFVSGGRVHEIAFNAKGRVSGEELGAALATVVGQDEFLVWQQLMPALSEMLKANQAGMAIFLVIFGLAAGLGVMNTLLMATHDRVREYGVLKALGVPGVKIVRDVAIEASLLAAVAVVIGTALGLALSAHSQLVGIPLGTDGEVSFGGISFPSVWKAHLLIDHVLISISLTFTMCVLASLYPGIRAARLNPVEAMNHV